MSDYCMKELKQWNEQIEDVARVAGLDCYPQEFELVSYEDMICYEAYIGMPSHYPHWSYGKAYERLKTLNRFNLTGLPYEMVINSNPCIAYLMKDNTLLLQILTIAHVYGHNDFFKCNRLFKHGTRAECTVEMFKNHADRIRAYISDPGIGYAQVEKILNAAHALKFQVHRVAEERHVTEEEKKQELLKKLTKPRNEFSLTLPEPEKEEEMPDFKKVPLEPEEDILFFIATHGRLLDWQVDIINIVREEALYFVPQMETKIINEGWASYWHYQLLQRLNLPQGLHMEFLKRHNQVIKPMEGRINPYYLGFKIFEDIYKRYGDQPEKIFEVRAMERDQSFIRRYLTEELCSELNLFEYRKVGSDYVISEVSDAQGWRQIRDTLATNAGMGALPVIRVAEWVKKDDSLLLEHLYDNRELELSYAYETLKHMVDLWDGKVMLETLIDGRKKVIICDEQKRISLMSS